MSVDVESPWVTIRAALIERLTEARKHADRAQAVYIAPYSGHDATSEHFRAQGVWQGIGTAIDVLDRLQNEAQAKP